MSCSRRQAGFDYIPDLSSRVAQFLQVPDYKAPYFVMEEGRAQRKTGIAETKLLSASSQILVKKVPTHLALIYCHFQHRIKTECHSKSLVQP